jgi:hypothetical protein
VIGVALAAGAGAFGVGFSLRASLRLARLAPRDAGLVEKELRSADDAAVASAIQNAFADAAPAMIDALTEKSDAATKAGAAALDERLGDLDRELSAGRAVSAAAARVALLSAGLGAVLELLRDLSGEGVVLALSAGAVGVASAGACFELGRRSARRSTELRAVWDRLASVAATRLGILVGAASPGPGGRSSSHAQGQGQGQRRRRRQIR